MNKDACKKLFYDLVYPSLPNEWEVDGIIEEIVELPDYIIGCPAQLFIVMLITIGTEKTVPVTGKGKDKSRGTLCSITIFTGWREAV